MTTILPGSGLLPSVGPTAANTTAATEPHAVESKSVQAAGPGLANDPSGIFAITAQADFSGDPAHDSAGAGLDQVLAFLSA
jgi:hypothetical protein